MSADGAVRPPTVRHDAGVARAVGPVAERVAEMLRPTIPRARRRSPVQPTPLTQRRRREAKGVTASPNTAPPSPPRVCRGCGSGLSRGRGHCGACHAAVLSETFPQVMAQGRIEAQRPDAQARRAATQRRHGSARSAWNPAELPSWLTGDGYTLEIRPRLRAVTTAAIASALGVSESYAAQIRAGAKRPHARHWFTLAKLAQIVPP